MSYDIYLEINTGNEMTTVVDCGNMTSNVAPMWRAAGCDLAELHGTRADDAVAQLRAAIQEMEDNPNKYKAFNPDNGWGSYEGCLEYLRQIKDACLQHPACQISVSR